LLNLIHNLKKQQAVEKEEQMKLVFKISFTVMFALFSFFAAGINATGSTVIKFSEIASKGQPQIIFADHFANLVAEKSSGSVEVKVFPDKILAGYSLDPIQSGIADMSAMVPGIGKDLVPWLSVLEAPYLIRTKNHFRKLADPNGVLLKQVNKELKKHNLIILTFYNFGTRDLTFKKAVYSPSDIAGAKIRVVPTPVWIATWKAIGATPIPMPSSEMVTAMLTGAVDGQENSWHDIAGKSLWDVQNAIMRTQHLMTFNALWMNLKSWNSMNKEQQDAFLAAAVEASTWYDNVFSEQKMPEYKKLFIEKGMKIIGPEDGLKVEEFRNKTKKVYKEFESDWQDWPKKIEKMAE
jgi:TRAP-type C4-dicarboxylate transport system substrate-binding protein